MTPFPDSFKAYVFHEGADRVRDAYRASVAAMENSRLAFQEAYARYEASVEDDTEYNEDGFMTHSTLHSLDYEAMNAGLVVTVVREAFITSAFHYWEVSARRWTGLYARGDTYKVLSEACAQKYQISPKLGQLNLLNNYLKHKSPAQAAALADIRTDYFARPLFESRGDNEQPQRLRISHDHVEEAIETVKASGPLLP